MWVENLTTRRSITGWRVSPDALQRVSRPTHTPIGARCARDRAPPPSTQLLHPHQSFCILVSWFPNSSLSVRSQLAERVPKKQPAQINEPAGRENGKVSGVDYIGLKRNLALARLAFALALRRDFCVGVSKARNRRTSSMIPSASSLLFRRLRARSMGSPLRTMTSGMSLNSD